MIKSKFEIDCEVLFFSPEKFKKLIDNSPFEISDDTLPRIYYPFLQREVSSVDPLINKGFGDDFFQLGDQVVYVQYATKYSDSKLNNLSVEKLLGVKASTRNLKACLKLI